MEIHDLNIDNNIIDSWYASTQIYGGGERGTPGTAYDGTLDIEVKKLGRRDLVWVQFIQTHSIILLRFSSV